MEQWQWPRSKNPCAGDIWGILDNGHVLLFGDRDLLDLIIDPIGLITDLIDQVGGIFKLFS